MSTYDILMYGAVGGGQTNDAPAIQAALDACHAAGGGTVLLPSGQTYLSGSLELRGQTELRVERGATLLASPDDAAYRPEHFSDAISSGLNGASAVTLRHVQVKWGPHPHAAFGQALFTQRAAGLIVNDFSSEDALA